MQTLLLFDIDGTLVAKASRAHAQALREALQVVHGVDVEALGLTPGPGAVAGRTDGEIARMLLLEAGVGADRIDEGAEAVRDECCRLYCELCPPDLSGKVIAGIPDLLEWLAGRDDVRLSLVTGNFQPVARVKLKRAGIGHWFEHDQGGFGSDSEDRSALPPIARRRAGSDGVSWPRAQTVVIGDTPRDIACARADDLRCVAVSSGPFDAAELGDADAVARSSRELWEALDHLLDGGA